MNWSVVVTTAPRKECTLIRTLESLADCGWSPDVFAEPGSTVTDFETRWNSTRLGVWFNWLQACRFALSQDADYILTAQDDCDFHPECRELVESIDWPKDAGYVSLYTPKHYQRWSDGKPRKSGLYPIKTSAMWGACALVFRPQVLQELINHPKAKSWIGVRCRSQKAWPALKQKRIENPWMIQNSDTIIGSALSKSMNRKLYYFQPSPVSHIARHSSIGHGGNLGRRNAEIIADHSLPLSYQVFGANQGHNSNHSISQMPAFVITRRPAEEKTKNRLLPLVGSLQTVVTDNNFPSEPRSKAILFVRDLVNNHIRAIEQGIAGNRYPFLVLEEDAYPSRWFSDAIDAPEADIIKLCYNKIPVSTNLVPAWQRSLPRFYPGGRQSWYRINHGYSTLAYAVCNQHAAACLLERLRSNHSIPADVTMTLAMQQIEIVIRSEPYFYHGPETNQAAQKSHISILQT